jgi:hypothetical protein
MIRRWSYINNLNTRFANQYSLLNVVHFESTFKTNIYFKKNIYKISKLSRKSWSRRKHLSNWLIYQNILSDWSNDYLFFRRYNKFVLNYQLLKSSFLSFNFSILKKNTPALIKDTELILFSSITKSISKYYINFDYSSYKFLLNFKNYSWIYATHYKNNNLINNVELLNNNPLFILSQSSLSSNKSKDNYYKYLTVILNFFISISLKKNLELYKMFILLTLFDIKKCN